MSVSHPVSSKADIIRTTGRILHNINLEIPAGTKVGVCGRTGRFVCTKSCKQTTLTDHSSGKSSLALTLLKLVDLDNGSILIDDVDIATVSHDDLRNAIVGVPQDFLTLDETLRLNIDPHNTKSEEDLVTILQRVQLWEACKTRGGLDMVIQENTLSYGELQLLAFARAMSRDSKVLVLDEVSSR